MTQRARERMSWFRNRRLRGALVVVNSKDGSADMRGIVRSVDAEHVTLTSVQVQHGSQTIESTCQRTLVPRANIAWIGVEKDGAL